MIIQAAVLLSLGPIMLHVLNEMGLHNSTATPDAYPLRRICPSILLAQSCYELVLMHWHGCHVKTYRAERQAV